MGAIEDLNTAIAEFRAQQTALSAAITQEIADFQAEVTTILAGNDPAIVAARDQIVAATADLTASLAAVTAADPGAQQSPPAP